MEEINLGELFDYYVSKLYIIIAFLVVVVLFGSLYSLVIKKPLYESNATVILAGKKAESTTYTQSDLTLNQNLTKTYSEIIKSRKVLNNVIEKQNLKYDVNSLSNMISVSNVDNTEIIKISVKSKDKKEACDIANAILPVFTEEVSSIYHFDNVSALDQAIEAQAPCNINFLKELVIYILIAFVLGAGTIFVLYYFDNSIRSQEVIEEKYHLNVIGQVPMVSKEK